MTEAFITVLFTSPLPVALVILGVLCVGLSIVGQIPSMNIRGVRAFALGTFGVLLIISAIVAAWLIALASNPSPDSPQTIITPTQQPNSGNPTAASVVATNTQTPASGGLSLCGEPAFDGDLQTTNPLFLRPEGFFSGWISSDPSSVTLPDGTTKVFETQYVLIVEDLPSVQVEGVQRQAGKANTWGCWYSADLSTFIAEDAKTDFCKKKAGGNVAVMYRVSSSGFEELATTATVSCP